MCSRFVRMTFNDSHWISLCELATSAKKEDNKKYAQTNNKWIGFFLISLFHSSSFPIKEEPKQKKIYEIVYWIHFRMHVIFFTCDSQCDRCKVKKIVFLWCLFVTHKVEEKIVSIIVFWLQRNIPSKYFARVFLFLSFFHLGFFIVSTPINYRVNPFECLKSDRMFFLAQWL